jgi:hypothetical protein
MSDDRLKAYAGWLTANRDKAGTPEFDTVAAKYKAIRMGGGAAADAPKAKPQKPAGGVLRQFAHGASFGFDDELAGLASAATGGDYDSARRSYIEGRQAYADENPTASFLANLAGGLSSGIGSGVKIAVTAPIKAAANVITSIPARSGLVGSAYGALQGAGDADDGNRMSGAGVGALIGGATGAALPVVARAVGNKIQAMADSAAARGAIPTTRELAAAAAKGYRAARNTGVEFAPGVLDDAGNKILADLNNAGYRDYLAPKTFRALSELFDKQNPNLSDLVGVRRLLRKAGLTYEERDAARRAIDALDDAMAGFKPSDVVAGDHKLAAKLLEDARGNYAAMMRGKEIERAIELADRQAARAGVGSNVDNSYRQRLTSVLNRKNGTRGFSPAELAELEGVVKGSGAANAARFIGHLSPTAPLTGGLGAIASAMMGGGYGAAASAGTGWLAKKTADALTQSRARALAEMLRSRSPEYARRFMALRPQQSAVVDAITSVGTPYGAIPLSLLAEKLRGQTPLEALPQ